MYRDSHAQLPEELNKPPEVDGLAQHHTSSKKKGDGSQRSQLLIWVLSTHAVSLVTFYSYN